jgi:hypothetical protein
MSIGRHNRWKSEAGTLLQAFTHQQHMHADNAKASRLCIQFHLCWSDVGLKMLVSGPAGILKEKTLCAISCLQGLARGGATAAVQAACGGDPKPQGQQWPAAEGVQLLEVRVQCTPRLAGYVSMAAHH